MTTSIKGEQSWLDNEPGGGGGIPSAPANSIQFNNGGAFGGSANLLFNSGTNTVDLIGDINATNFNGAALTDAGVVTNYLDATGNYSIPGESHIPLKTVYVETEADFGPLVQKNVPGIGLADFHETADNTHYMLLSSVTLTDNLTTVNGGYVKITSGNILNAQLTSDPTVPGSPVFFANGPAGVDVVFSNIVIVNGGASPLSKIFNLSVGSTLLVNGVKANFFPFVATLTNLTQIWIKNNEFINTSSLMFDLVDCTIVNIEGNTLANTTNSNFVRIAGTTGTRSNIHNNIVINQFSSFFMRIESTLSGGNTLITSNNVSDTAMFYDTSAGGLNQNSAGVSAFANEGSIASNTVADSFNSVPLTAGGVATNYLDETGGYSTVPEGEKPFNVVYVTTENDFGPIVSKSVPDLGINVDFHQLTNGKEYVLIGAPVLTRTLTLTSGDRCTITSGNRGFLSLVANPNTPNAPTIFVENGFSILTLKNVDIQCSSGSASEKIFDFTGGASGTLNLDNVLLTNTNNIGSLDNITGLNINSLSVLPNSVSIVGLVITDIATLNFHNSQFNWLGTNTFMSVASTVKSTIATINDNSGTISTGSFIRIDPSNQLTSTFSIVANDLSTPANFFDTSAGGLDQTDSKVFAFSNKGVTNSATVAESFNGVVLTDGGVVTNYLDETGAYSVPAAVPAGVNVVHVTTEADFGPLINKIVPVIGAADFHQLATNTHYILVNDITPLNNLIVGAGVKVSISSSNFNGARLIYAPTVAGSPMFYSENISPFNSLRLNDFEVFPAVPAATDVLFQLAGAGAKCICNNLKIDLFQSPGSFDALKFASVTHSILDFVANGLGFSEVVNTLVSNNSGSMAAGRFFTFSSNATVNGIFSNNIMSGAADFINANLFFTSNSKLVFTSNSIPLGSTFFDTGGGGLDQTNSKILAFSNSGVTDSATVAESFNGVDLTTGGVITNFLNATGGYSVPAGGGGGTRGIANVYSKTTAPTTQTITSSNVLQEFNAIGSTILPWTANSLLVDFTFDAPSGQMTYTGSGGDFMVTAGTSINLSSPGSQDLGIGVLLDTGGGMTPIIDSIYSTPLTLSGAGRFNLVKWPLTLANGNIITVGIINKTTTTAIEVSQPMWSIEEI